MQVKLIFTGKGNYSDCARWLNGVIMQVLLGSLKRNRKWCRLLSISDL